jgi:hypothetical protein
MPPNIVVDGSPNDSTLLTLSHWPKSGTPSELKADTSTEIAFRYLESPRLHVSCELVTNNHFDQDGLFGIFALINPALSLRYRDLMIDVASAGDFSVFESRQAARIAFAVGAMSEEDTSPFPKAIFDRPYPEMAADLYVRALELVPDLLVDTDKFRGLWEEPDAALSESEAWLEAGRIGIREIGEMDLAIAELPSGIQNVHPMALYRRTHCSRIVLLAERQFEFQYRYESWVQLVSRRPAARVDLAPLVMELNSEERSGGSWNFDGVDAVTPRLFLEGAGESSLPGTRILEKLLKHLASGPPAWAPYDAS